jgi:hypothetical protein
MRKLLFLSLLFAVAFSVSAQTMNYQVHSLFVLNIAKYSTWPTNSGEFHIVVFGKSKMCDEMVKNLTGKNINGVAVKVTQTSNIAEIGAPQILLLSDGQSSELSEILKITEGKSTMVIAEREGLYKKGAGFSFVIMDNNTLRYDINNAELEKRSIKISKNLSSLANSVI